MLETPPPKLLSFRAPSTPMATGRAQEDTLLLRAAWRPDSTLGPDPARPDAASCVGSSAKTVPRLRDRAESGLVKWPAAQLARLHSRWVVMAA